MSEIFISYKSERRRAAEHLAEVLKGHGYSVWFDYDLIKGEDFGLQIDRKVREARALIVLWCTMSVTSRWVYEEVDLAHSLGILVPVKIEPCELPAGFRRLDYIDLSTWDGAPRSHQLDPLMDALEQRIGRPPSLDLKALRAYESTWRRFGAPPLTAFALGRPIEVDAGERRLPGRETAAVATAPAKPSLGEAEREWRSHGLDRCDDPGLLKVYATRWEAADPLWSYKARRRAAVLEADLHRQEAETARRREEEHFRLDGRVPVDVGRNDETVVKWYKPGSGKTEWFNDLSESPEMVVVPAGEFLMGSTPEEFANLGKRFKSEHPQHKVVFSKPFAVGRFAVTFDEWDAAVAAGGVTPKPADQGWGRGRRPVINISWEDATAYVDWLCKLTGKAYRLLSEAEWEYVARAGTSTAFWWGERISTEQANYQLVNEYRKKTMPVDSFAPNPWGLYQVHGNVWEWCEDVWHDSYRGAPADGSAWTAGGEQGFRVLRGGSWSYYASFLRAACRFRYRPDGRVGGIGFPSCQNALTSCVFDLLTS